MLPPSLLCNRNKKSRTIEDVTIDQIDSDESYSNSSYIVEVLLHLEYNIYTFHSYPNSYQLTHISTLFFCVSQTTNYKQYVCSSTKLKGTGCIPRH